MKKDVKEVLDKISSGNYNPEEETIAKLWLHQLHQNDEAGLSEQEIQEVSDQMWLSLEPNKKQPQLNKYRKLVVYMAAAASLALIIGVGLYFNQPPPLSKSIQAKAFANDIPAGSNKAYLTLANGKKLALTNSANGTLAEEAGIKITKTADGQLVYTIADQGEKGIAGYNSIETPRGGQYQLNLPDGTKIWINSASSLKYPASFASLKERRVELSGEAYFEVAKDKTHPFIVKSGRQEIQVLGTHFDVNAYPDEQLIKTTLLEGSVKLNKQVVLKPGEQSSLTGEKFTVKAVNVNDAVDWKNGEFVFTNESLTSILKKVSRWYDVEIKYVRTPANMPTFTGSVSRSENISGVLKMLEETSNVRFSIEGKQVSVITK
ncbi:ferric-dicitrate binding protein FerR (iron transport regulator) [Pedobacter cryoconitis]|uniref:Ferric-dicitrate binding protein FerR (Iron transport regulator) n=1 Tax=Pedobacter cryoconitis TaxID=188932 RepID=A0A7W8YVV2_9SPHI|nr:FecR family protein [Pedobacter cryoconitis]MBB5622744.1 ferric-dicitrate binding protein FerR (iron transport regulator) [Pedobacter cryoconitis]MBB5648903.1 ferric-dicitrate binding protein FerR (iron transport regulator) [Pedobacter cryoconitis]